LVGERLSDRADCLHGRDSRVACSAIQMGAGENSVNHAK